jgi:hypothetical protein
MDVFVPIDGHPIRTMIVAGSGIVGGPDFRGEYLAVDYEGNLYGARNIVTYADRVNHAHGRMVDRYPTIARTLVEPEAMTKVGTYDPVTGVVTLFDGAMGIVLRWCSIPRDQLASQLLTTTSTHIIAREQEKN